MKCKCPHPLSFIYTALPLLTNYLLYLPFTHVCVHIVLAPPSALGAGGVGQDHV